MRKKSLVGFAGLFLLTALTACGGSDTTTETSVVETTETTSTSSTYPVTVGDLTLATQPMRIVSLSPTATEMLYAIGAGKQVVAVYWESKETSDASLQPFMDSKIAKKFMDKIDQSSMSMGRYKFLK